MTDSRPEIVERRAHARYPIHTSSTLCLHDGRAVPARTLDIGWAGSAVVCDLNLRVGTTLVMRMTLPARPSGNRLFETRATVRYVTLAGSDGGFRVGLEFSPLSRAATAALQGLLGP